MNRWLSFNSLLGYFGAATDSTMQKRRNFLKTVSTIGGALYFSSHLSAIPKLQADSKISCQQYPWYTFFQREGASWGADLAYSMKQLASAGFNGFEPTIDSTEEVESLKPLLNEHQLQTHSLYVNSILHDPKQVETSISEVMNIALVVKPLGTKILVTNPSPIRWDGDEDKTDDQLEIQAKALNQLGKKLHQMGLTLAYHNHDAEMRNSAREFHHMMNGTDQEYVRLCLDAHWIYRGSGNSQVALFDIVSLYVNRIEELHLRQSKEGIWTEEFCQGDIDYQRLAKYLLANNKKPHLVLEQAVEQESPQTMSAVEAHQLGLAYAEEVFADF